MEISSIVKNFYFDGCSIRQLEINNDMISLDGGEIMKLGIDSDPTYLGINHEKHLAGIQMKITVDASKGNESVKSSLKMLIEGKFSSPANVDKETFMQMVAINGAAALYSVARGRIDAITAVVFSNGKIDIPFVNFYSIDHVNDEP